MVLFFRFVFKRVTDLALVVYALLFVYLIMVLDSI